MFETLASQIYALVKTFGEDKIVMQNSGILSARWPYCDAQACEAVDDWSETQHSASEHAGAVRAGKVAVMMLGSRAESIANAYACARLNGWLVADRTSDSAKLAESVLSIRLGKPLSDAKPIGDALYRVFEKGVVVLNPAAAATLTLALPRSGKLNDVSHDRELLASGGKLVVDMSPESGRVMLWRD